jgi:hypothetical protein
VLLVKIDGIMLTSMSFVIHFNLADFMEVLSANSVVYSVSYTETALGKTDAVVVLTSDAGLAGGPVHAARLIIDAEKGDEASVVSTAEKFGELLELKGMIWHQGIMLTEGLREALRYYGKTGVSYSGKQLDELLIKEKEKPKKRGLPPFSEASNDK